MSETLYLVAHKVRGEPAFDVAIQMTCPKCNGGAAQHVIDGPMFCSECDDSGHWWIIPTSGHRAHPWWSASFEEIGIDILPDGCWGYGRINATGLYEGIFSVDQGFASLPDHYQDSRAPAQARPAFLDRLLGNAKPKLSTPVARRGF